MNYNFILYDQRGCGRSSIQNSHERVVHADNVDDLYKLSLYLKEQHQLNIAALMGHSYGAKIVFDFQKKYPASIPLIFIATAESILIPRLNNLLLDFTFLKKEYPERYKSIVEKMENVNFEKIWDLTEELAPVFLENKERPYHYWANLDVFKMAQEVQAKLKISVNHNVFMSVRKDLYSSQNNYSVDI